MKMYFPYIIAGVILISVIFILLNSLKDFKNMYNIKYGNNKDSIYIIIIIIIISIIIVLI